MGFWWDSVGFSLDSVGFSVGSVGFSVDSVGFAFLLFCVGMWGHFGSPVPWRHGRWFRGIRAEGPKPTDKC